MRETLKRTAEFGKEVGWQLVDTFATTGDHVRAIVERLIRGPYSDAIAAITAASAGSYSLLALIHYLLRNYHYAAFFVGLALLVLTVLAVHLHGSYRWMREQYIALEEDYENEVAARQDARSKQLRVARAMHVLSKGHSEVCRKLSESFVKNGRLSHRNRELGVEVEELTTENRRLILQRDTSRELYRNELLNGIELKRQLEDRFPVPRAVVTTDIADYYARTHKINRNSVKNIVTAQEGPLSEPTPVTLHEVEGEIVAQGTLPEGAAEQIIQGRITGISVDQDGMGSIITPGGWSQPQYLQPEDGIDETEGWDFPSIERGGYKYPTVLPDAVQESMNRRGE